jgi:hypothetical protein
MAWRALLLDGTLLVASVCYRRLGVESGDGDGNKGILSGLDNAMVLTLLVPQINLSP